MRGKGLKGMFITEKRGFVGSNGVDDLFPCAQQGIFFKDLIKLAKTLAAGVKNYRFEALLNQVGFVSGNCNSAQIVDIASKKIKFRTSCARQAGGKIPVPSRRAQAPLKIPVATPMNHLLKVIYLIGLKRWPPKAQNWIASHLNLNRLRILHRMMCLTGCKGWEMRKASYRQSSRKL